ncbi:hypothetical protein BDV93DRAFT_564046 [Ceratobasidium sp. AG-I]|nr:hypothetical protein BDV93DRAFT_564046 [Ceratobasidium sp. AG-I]
MSATRSTRATRPHRTIHFARTHASSPRSDGHNDLHGTSSWFDSHAPSASNDSFHEHPRCPPAEIDTQRYTLGQ